jgi:capsular exopolysaccharide synthesis family protein
MDRLTKALHLAGRRPRPPRSASVAQQKREIVYTRTRRLNPDREFLSEQRLISGIEDKRIIDAYKLLRTRVMHRMVQNNWKTLGITSAGENEGKTLTCINLGISIAMKLDQTVLLVDADMRRPTVHSLFGFTPKLGLVDHLESGTSIEKMLVQPGVEGIVVLPGRSTTKRSSELLTSVEMAEFVDECKNRYPSRFVLFDLPPGLVGDDVVAFAPYLDAILIVVEDNSTQTTDLARTLEVLEDIELLGVVLNKSSEHMQGYDYHHYY